MPSRRSILAFSALTIVAAATSLAEVPSCTDYDATPTTAAVRVYAHPVTDVVLTGDLVLAAVAEEGLLVYDGIDPTMPWYLGQAVLSGSGWEIAADGALAVMAGHDDHVLHVIDLTTPSTPVPAGAAALPGRPVDVAAGDGFAHVLCDPLDTKTAFELVSVDLSDPEAPAIVHTRQVADQAAALDLGGTLLAVAGPLSPNLQLLDAGDPASPVPLGSWHGGGLVRDVDLDGTSAWLTGHEVLRRVDLADPNAPTLAWSHPDASAWRRLDVEGGRVFLLNDPEDETEPGLAVLDAASPEEPALAISALGAVALAARDGWLFAADVGQALTVVDARDLRRIEPLATLPPPEETDAVIGVAADRGLAVMLSDGRNDLGQPVSKLTVLDVVDPLAARSGATLEMTYGARAVAQQNNMAAVVAYREGVNLGELILLDVSDPDAPTVTSSTPLSGDPVALNFRGTLLDVLIRATGAGGYLTDYWQMVSVADPSAPGFFYPVYLPDVPTAFGTDGLRLMVSGEGFLDLYDVSEPTSPVLSESWYVSYAARSVDLAGEVFVLGGDGFLLTGDLSLPGILNVEASLPLSGSCDALHRSGDVLYAAAGDLTVFDVSLNDDPRAVGTAGFAAGRDVTMNGGMVFGAAGRRGVQLLRTHCDGGVGVEDPDDGGTPVAPRTATLGKPRPNPFNPHVSVAFALSRPGPVRVVVQDAMGRVVAVLADGRHAAGEHELTWRGVADDGRDAPAGVYFLRMTTDEGTLGRKMSLVR